MEFAPTITDGWAHQIVGVDASVPVLDGTMRPSVNLDNPARIRTTYESRSAARPARG